MRERRWINLFLKVSTRGCHDTDDWVRLGQVLLITESMSRGSRTRTRSTSDLESPHHLQVIVVRHSTLPVPDHSRSRISATPTVKCTELIIASTYSDCRRGKERSVQYRSSARLFIIPPHSHSFLKLSPILLSSCRTPNREEQYSMPSSTPNDPPTPGQRLRRDLFFIVCGIALLRARSRRHFRPHTRPPILTMCYRYSCPRLGSTIPSWSYSCTACSIRATAAITMVSLMALSAI
jgi:hypothetical protein